MTTTSPLLLPIAFSSLLEKPSVSAGNRSCLSDPRTFLKRSPFSDWDKPSQQRTTVILLHLLQHKNLSLYQHSLRVRHLSRQVSEYLLLSPQENSDLETAALLHDIGKIALPDALLQKPERLTPEEFELVKQHSLSGARILSWIKMPDPITTLVYHHHERWDGSGYPDGLAGEAIPLGARIITLCDTFDVMTSSRPYQVARTQEQALEELQRCSGQQFDPQFVNLFCHLWANASHPPDEHPPPVYK